MIDVKICGMSSLELCEYAIEQGATTLGFIFYKKSPRYIEPQELKKWSHKLKGKAELVGVFVNEHPDTVIQVMEDCGLDIVQLHGNESQQDCEMIDFPIIKAFSVGKEFDKKQLLNYSFLVDEYLFDTYKKGQPGGTGETFNWDLLKGLDTHGKSLILSGGLNPNNICEAVKSVNPDMVDVNSGVESEPGVKSKELIAELFKNLRAM